MHRPERGISPAGFRDQLLARLRNYARQHEVSVQRIQQRVAFERLLARLALSGDWVLKGGFALELRYHWASRPTRDIDLRTTASPLAALAQFRTAIAESNLADHFTFDITSAGNAMQGAHGATVRIRIIARIARVTFADFHVDLSSGDALIGNPDVLTGSDLLRFAGFEPIQFPAYPVSQHLAEKLHAYTLPRTEENTRVKDLVDLVAIASAETVEGSALLRSLSATFGARSTHPHPKTLPEPPVAWAAPFARLAVGSSLVADITLHDGYLRAARFWNPALAGLVKEKWWIPSLQIWGTNAHM